ncbi:hypothetical protein EDEG_03437 [Edhazardia aedis USNM 41457]|uniref:Uncharacterized protein n=1 Tax=Edhazardia aedis (strain USNM 41457) TaxID=1003232 RepID=J9D3K4_EDHAE|nr:hypothetical protein EDEG_03437 [Edhazardia aedis USNM 41457]|eukprot:EJW02119.1 hypothetical protein EDEG_03437 [Edhazardia aedis USNM 41457]
MKYNCKGPKYFCINFAVILKTIKLTIIYENSNKLQYFSNQNDLRKQEYSKIQDSNNFLEIDDVVLRRKRKNHTGISKSVSCILFKNSQNKTENIYQSPQKLNRKSNGWWMRKEWVKSEFKNIVSLFKTPFQNIKKDEENFFYKNSTSKRNSVKSNLSSNSLNDRESIYESIRTLFDSQLFSTSVINLDESVYNQQQKDESSSEKQQLINQIKILNDRSSQFKNSLNIIPESNLTSDFYNDPSDENITRKKILFVVLKFAMLLKRKPKSLNVQKIFPVK